MSCDMSEWDGPLHLSDVEERPACLLVLNYGALRIDKLGQIVTPSQVKNRPTIQWEGMDPKKLYTVIFTDPDVPSRDNCHLGQWHHYLVVNVKGNDLSSGCTLTEYVGVGAAKGTGHHRYTWLVYEQTTELKCNEQVLSNRKAEGREKFNAAKFRKKYKLHSPAAGICFLGEWDESVLDLYKQLGVE
ncbi:phosphatidylethanolamine-binding protein 1-like [Pseudophryne corroboree]|uniref:phosphatidylethanolamine-binding protein 1-like n=1 Tax=Pseudophryne corroboree TaxID=495146 RepID=UPI00308150EE